MSESGPVGMPTNSEFKQKTYSYERKKTRQSHRSGIECESGWVNARSEGHRY